MTYKPSKGPSRALVVDDHGISRSYSVAALRQIVPAVKQAAGVGEAIDLAMAWLPDLLLVDIDLPDGSGLELIADIRRRWPPDRAPPRVVVYTGQPDFSAQSEEAPEGIDGILLKPATLHKLQAAVRNCSAPQVQEETGRQSLLRLRDCFRDELCERLPALERAILDSDRRGAASILHQLIASSAICGESLLEDGLRALDQAIRHDEGAAAVVRAWRRVSEASRNILIRSEVDRPGPDRVRR